MKLISLAFGCFIFLGLIFILSSKAYSKKKHHKTSNSLTEFQKYVTQHGGTEPAFNNEYWNEKRDGIYVDVASGEALFSSKDKYDSGTGWPSFTRPIKKDFVFKKVDNSHGMKRVEVKSRSSDSHLGHVFNDGPKAQGGQRYCINSASLKFVPKEDLEKEGYGKYLEEF